MAALVHGLSTALAVHAGATPALRLMLGTQQIWAAAPPLEPFTFIPGAADHAYSNGNRTVTKGNSSDVSVLAGVARSGGKWYAEFLVDAHPWGISFGLADSVSTTARLGSYAISCAMAEWGSFMQSGFVGATVDSSLANIGGLAVDRRMCIAVDFDARKVWFSVDGAWLSSADPGAGTGPTLYGWSSSLALQPGVRLPAETSTVTIPGSFLHAPAGFSAWGALA